MTAQQQACVPVLTDHIFAKCSVQSCRVFLDDMCTVAVFVPHHFAGSSVQHMALYSPDIFDIKHYTCPGVPATDMCLL
jgi:hypothetical protein